MNRFCQDLSFISLESESREATAKTSVSWRWWCFDIPSRNVDGIQTLCLLTRTAVVLSNASHSDRCVWHHTSPAPPDGQWCSQPSHVPGCCLYNIFSVMWVIFFVCFPLDCQISSFWVLRVLYIFYILVFHQICGLSKFLYLVFSFS